MMPAAKIQHEWTVFVCAYQFLTRIPAPPGFRYSEEAMQEAARYYPLVGALVGLAAALVYMLLTPWLPGIVSILIATMFTVYFTGAFHEDGFADFCDGIGGGRDAEHALDIMRDSRLGTYGTIGLLLIVLLKLSLLASLSFDPGVLMMALVLGHGLSRASAVVVIVTSDYVRSAGTAKPVATELSREGRLVALFTALILLVLGVAAIPWAAVVGAGVALIVAHFAIRARFEKWLGGYTGDCLGAVQQVCEVDIPRDRRVHLILLRHTRTIAGSGICYGNTDVELAETAAEEIAVAVSQLQNIDQLYSSPLQRCTRLAEAIARAFNLPVQIDERLAEMDFGTWQGLSWDDVPRHELDLWADDFFTAKPHGGENVEELRCRVLNFLTDLSKQVDPEARVVIVSHAGVIRSLQAVLFDEDERSLRIDYGGSVALTYSVED